jgi:hypothetical protein
LTSETPSEDELLDEIRSAFGFLDPPVSKRAEIQRGSFAVTVAYLMEPITIEVHVDWRESAVEVLLCRTVDGGRPPGWYAHAGRRMRVLLHVALRSGPPQFRDLAVQLERKGRAFATAGLRERTAGLLQIESDCVRAVFPELASFYPALFADGDGK